MTDIQILEKAIAIARANGWKMLRVSIKEPPAHTLQRFKMSGIECDDTKGGNWKPRCAWETLFYSHDFAKALWGEEPFTEEVMTSRKILQVDNGFMWQYHLQQMVIADAPIKYLGEHI